MSLDLVRVEQPQQQSVDALVILARQEQHVARPALDLDEHVGPHIQIRVPIRLLLAALHLLARGAGCDQPRPHRFVPGNRPGGTQSFIETERLLIGSLAEVPRRRTVSQ